MVKTNSVESWLTTDKIAVAKLINNAWNGSLFLFMFGLLGILIKAVLIMEGTDLLPELNIILTLCWIGFFFLFINARYFSLVYRLIPDETTSKIE